MRFLFFTKTDWIEPPRMRHQLARLLADAGHQIIFFQRPYFLWQRIATEYISDNFIMLYRYRQLIHHKLRLHWLLHHVNALFEVSQIRFFISRFSINSNDVIVNFCYEYYFLRSLFPANRIITIINDDFWSSAIAGYQEPLEWALKRVIKRSDIVLTVSLPLQNKLSQMGDSKLFAPWSDSSYEPPPATLKKDTLLYWGFINSRVDFNYISKLASAFSNSSCDFKILLVGPLQCSKDSLASLSCIHNVEVRPAAELDAIDFSRIFSAIIPYKHGIKEVDAITFPNKAFRLLSKGLPIAITGMPNFMDAPFVFRLPLNPQDAVPLVRDLHGMFGKLQPIIKCFVNKNRPEHRLQQFMSYL